MQVYVYPGGFLVIQTNFLFSSAKVTVYLGISNRFFDCILQIYYAKCLNKPFIYNNDDRSKWTEMSANKEYNFIFKNWL